MRDVASASWDGMVYRTTQPSSYTRIRLPEPLAGSAEQTRGWFDADVEHLIAQVGPDLVVE